jgi:myo-inositol-1(or 4)-monophosphatase
MSAELEAAVAAARAAGRLLNARKGETHQVAWKGDADPVTEMDREVQALIVGMLSSAFPSYGMLGEEGEEQLVSAGPCWVVDPLDGTVNYMRGYPFFCVSIALERNEHLTLGVVYDPVRDELFAAERGMGATCNGNPIRVSPTTTLDKGVVGSGFPYDARISEVDNARQWGRFLKRALSLRADGAAALDLCYVAMGRTDAFWELDLMPWDVAAGVVIVEEADGKVTHVTGAEFNPYGHSVLASNGHLHSEMLDLLNDGVS